MHFKLSTWPISKIREITAGHLFRGLDQSPQGFLMFGPLPLLISLHIQPGTRYFVLRTSFRDLTNFRGDFRFGLLRPITLTRENATEKDS